MGTWPSNAAKPDLPANADGTSGNNGVQAQKIGNTSAPSVSACMPMQSKGSDASTTYGPLTDGNINIGGHSMTSAAGLGAHTDAQNANTTIAELPDLKTVVSNQQAMAAATGTIVATSTQIAGDISVAAQKQADKADQDIAQARATLADLTSSQSENDNAHLFFINPTGTLLLRVSVHFYSAIDTRKMVSVTPEPS